MGMVLALQIATTSITVEIGIAGTDIVEVHLLIGVEVKGMTITGITLVKETGVIMTTITATTIEADQGVVAEAVKEGGIVDVIVRIGLAGIDPEIDMKRVGTDLEIDTEVDLDHDLERGLERGPEIEIVVDLGIDLEIERDPAIGEKDMVKTTDHGGAVVQVPTRGIMTA